MAEEFEEEFNQLGIEYRCELVEEKQTYYTFLNVLPITLAVLLY